MKEKVIFGSIEPTNNCNLDCITCARSDILNRFSELEVGSINTEFLEVVKTILPDLIEVKFHGLGEPFLAKNTVLLHKKMKELYPNVNLISITNAAIPKFPVQVKDYLDHIVISIDHAQKEIFEKLRRKAKFELVLNNALKITEKNTSHQPKVSINCCFNSETYKDLYQMIILARSLRINDVRFNLVQEWVEDSNVEKILLDEINIDELVESILYAVKISSMLGISMKIIGNPEFRIEDCNWTRKMIYITKDGEIAPCCMRIEPRYYFGSFRKKPFEQIWNGKEMNRFREDRIKGKYPKICKNCPYVFNSIILRELRNRNIALTNDFIGHKYRD